MFLLLSILSQRRYFLTFLIVFVIFVAIYLSATQFLFFIQPAERAESFFAVKVSENWKELLFRQRAPFLFEPIGAILAGPFKFFISIPNWILAFALGVLVASNIAVSYYSFRRLGLRGARGFSALVGTLPAILSGAACCVPTLILIVGLQLTATLAAVWPFFVPLSFLLLLLSLWWSLRKI